jgi:hypothetical protein
LISDPTPKLTNEEPENKKTRQGEECEKKEKKREQMTLFSELIYCYYQDEREPIVEFGPIDEGQS